MAFVKKLVWFLWIGVFLLCMVELFKKPDITQRILGIQLFWLVGGAGFLMALVKNELPKRLLFIDLILAIIGMILTKIFDTYFYPNFSYSNFHIFPDGFTVVSFLLVTPLVIDYLKTKDFLAILSMVVLMYWTIINLSGTLTFATKKLVFAAKNPKATYDDKMRVEWGKFYDCMLIVKKNTPENASVYIPPQTGVWQMEGNEYLVRYFLYPREVMHYKTVSEASKSANPYFIYSWGFWPGERKYGAWPYEKFEVSSGKFVDHTNNFDFVKSIEFNRNGMRNKETCGVIKPVFK